MLCSAYLELYVTSERNAAGGQSILNHLLLHCLSTAMQIVTFLTMFLVGNLQMNIKRLEFSLQFYWIPKRLGDCWGSGVHRIVFGLSLQWTLNRKHKILKIVGFGTVDLKGPEGNFRWHINTSAVDDNQSQQFY